MIDYIEIADVFDGAACSALCAEIRAALGRPAGLLGRADQKMAWPEIRKTVRADVSQATEERVSALLAQQKAALERHFGLLLGQVEKPQFLHYRQGDFFCAAPGWQHAAHSRRVAVPKDLGGDLSQPSIGQPFARSYAGGSLVLHGPYSGPDLRIAMPALPGSLVAFRSETTHEVTPVTCNERFTIVSWYRGT
ncbi:2OG-Fe(II) oxygenase [Mesorhizobium sp. LSHC422A00]|uniref:2OG-Fe(II) oxygenase n=1 Tax=Mesorhizobium sp. LSHC422A00 TaxID=1287294 RepID=UPI001FD8D0D3|nr:2OG-Fe(II) oxygenase [Mesorhizobium sp. LSHC422A00]